jgi:thioredoxin reductase
MYDLIIIGGGPAGLTATVYALRKRLNVRLITKDLGGKTNYRLQLPHSEHHLVINGEETLNRFVNELEYLEFARVMETAEQVSKIAGGYRVRTGHGQAYDARAVIVATGAAAKRLNVPGEREFLRRGLSYSAISYAPLFIERDVVVVGDGERALQATVELAHIARRVTFLPLAASLLDSDLGRRLHTFTNVSVLENYRVESVKGDEFARALVVAAPNGATRELEADGFFIELGLLPNTELVRGLVALNANGCIEVDARNHTSAPGLFAAGDVTDAFAEQVLIAIGEGAKAALSAFEYLLHQPLPVEATTPEWSRR